MDNEKVYLYIPFSFKDVAKALGAKWDVDQKRWYSTRENIESSELKKYLEEPTKIYYRIHYDEKDFAKKMGGRWDKDKKMWFAMSDNDAFHQAFINAEVIPEADCKRSNHNVHTFWKAMK